MATVNSDPMTKPNSDRPQDELPPMVSTRARIWRGVTEAGAFERTVAEHRAICEAIAARDPELAHARALAHVGGVMEWLRKSAG